MARIGIIAGSGFYEIEGVRVKEIKKITTPYGAPSDVYRVCESSGAEFVFLSRHGSPHHIPPHRINYRANIWGFRETGVERILAVNAVGGINTALKSGDIAILDQVIDMTHGRAATFHEEEEVIHINFTDPYCPELRHCLLKAGSQSDIKLWESGTYICTNGPRLETKAEIGFFAGMGGDVVGMTGMPEAVLAREMELCLSGIAVITNYAAGISGSILTTTEVVENMKAAMGKIRSLLLGTIQLIPEKRNCGCINALKDARL